MLLEWSTSIDRTLSTHSENSLPAPPPSFLPLSRSFSINAIKSQTKYWLWV